MNELLPALQSDSPQSDASSTFSRDSSVSAGGADAAISWPLPSAMALMPEPTWGLCNEARYLAWPASQWHDCEATVRSADAVISLFGVKLKNLAADKQRARSKLGHLEKQKIKQIISENEKIRALNEPFALFISLRRHYFTHEKVHLASRLGTHPSAIPDERVVDRLTETASSCDERDRLESDRRAARERAFGMAGLAGQGGFGLGLSQGDGGAKGKQRAVEGVMDIQRDFRPFSPVEEEVEP